MRYPEKRQGETKRRDNEISREETSRDQEKSDKDSKESEDCLFTQPNKAIHRDKSLPVP